MTSGQLQGASGKRGPIVTCCARCSRELSCCLPGIPAAGLDSGAALQHAGSAQAGGNGGAAAPLAAAVRLNLARALCKAGRYGEAMSLYGEMEYMAGGRTGPALLPFFLKERCML